MIDHVGPQDRPGSDGNIYDVGECCVFRLNLLIDPQFEQLT